METVARTPSQLASALLARRQRKKLTQRQAGRDVGLLPKTISALEQTPERCSLLSLYRLLSALDLELVVRERSPATPATPTTGPEW